MYEKRTWNADDNQSLLPVVLDQVNMIRMAVGIGEGKLPELPKGVRGNSDYCVLARALSNGWRAEVGTGRTTIVHKGGIEGIDIPLILRTLRDQGFEAFSKAEQFYDNTTRMYGQILTGIEIKNTMAMRSLVRQFDSGYFPGLFENPNEPEKFEDGREPDPQFD